MTPTDADDYLDLVARHWYELRGLLTAEVFALLVSVAVINALNFPTLAGALTILATFAAVLIAWHVSRRLPKNKPGRLGVVVSIACEDDAESRRIRSDFIAPLRSNIESGSAGEILYLLEMPDHVTKRVHRPEDAMRIRQATNGHFMIFGRVKMRRLEGKMQHVVELEGLVAHREASMEIRRRFVKEFTELLPRRLMIAEDNDLLSFRFTAEWAEVVAKYILGVAAAMSGDLDVSETLYRDAQERLTQKDKTFGIYRVLSERLPLRIAELYEAKASWAYREWLNTFADELLETFRESLNKFNEMKVPVTLRVRFLLAIKLFVCDRDVRGALTALKPLKNKFDPLWNYNMAFLKGYSGDLKSAARHYRYASKSEIDADILIQIEEFLFWIIEKEPAKEHVHFCLGMFYQLAKGDLVSSVNHFELFLKAKNIASFPAEAALATSWIEEIKKDASWPAIPFSPA